MLTKHFKICSYSSSPFRYLLSSSSSSPYSSSFSHCSSFSSSSSSCITNNNNTLISSYNTSSLIMSHPYSTSFKKNDKKRKRKMYDNPLNGRDGIILPQKELLNIKLRLSKMITRSGLCSSRMAEKLIDSKRISVDGVVISKQGSFVSPAQTIRVDGKLLPEIEPRLFIHNKPKGTLVTHYDPHYRVAIFPHFKKMGLPHLISVGRLDFASEGLLLVTNYPPLASLLERPSNNFERKYAVRVRGHMTKEKIRVIQRGITVKNTHYKGMSIYIPPQYIDKKTKWIHLGLMEGKNREIRTIMEHLKLDVLRLKRIEYGPYKLGKSEVGSVREVDIHQGILKQSDDPWLRHMIKEEEEEEEEEEEKVEKVEDDEYNKMMKERDDEISALFK